MKKLLYLSMLAITILASCNSKEKEDKAFARVSTSNNPQEMRAYLDNYFEEASPEHRLCQYLQDQRSCHQDFFGE